MFAGGGGNLDVGIKLAKEADDKIFKTIEHAEHEQDGCRTDGNAGYGDSGDDMNGVGGFLSQEIFFGDDNR